MCLLVSTSHFTHHISTDEIACDSPKHYTAHAHNSPPPLQKSKFPCITPTTSTSLSHRSPSTNSSLKIRLTTRNQDITQHASRAASTTARLVNPALAQAITTTTPFSRSKRPSELITAGHPYMTVRTLRKKDTNWKRSAGSF